MERKSDVVKEDATLIQWRKKGGGSFRMANGRIIKPGQIFKARLDEIPEGFRDVVVPVNAEMFTKVQSVQESSPAVELDYFVKHISSGWYNVVDADDKVQNEKKLRKVDAETLLNSLK